MFDQAMTSKFVKKTTYLEKNEPKSKKSERNHDEFEVVKTLESSKLPLNDSKNLTSHGNFDTNSSVLDKSIEDDILHFQDLKKQSSRNRLKKQSASAKQAPLQLQKVKFEDNKKSVPNIEKPDKELIQKVQPPLEDSEKMLSILSLGPSNTLSQFSEFQQQKPTQNRVSSPHKQLLSHRRRVEVLDMKQEKEIKPQKPPKRRWTQLAKQCAIDSQPPDEATKQMNKVYMQKSVNDFMLRRTQKQQPQRSQNSNYKSVKKQQNQSSVQVIQKFYDFQVNRRITGFFQTKRKNQLKKAANHGFLDLDNSQEVIKGVKDRFKTYTQRFLDLTKRSFVDTQIDVIDVKISNDSKLAIAVLSDEDTCLIVRWFSLETDENEDNIYHIGEMHIDGDFFIKAKQVSQDQLGKLYCLPYLEDGIFFIQLFNVQGELQRVNINDLLGLEELTTPIFGFSDPLINCVFCNDGQIFVNLFHNFSQINWHFMYSYQDQKIIGKPIGTKMDCLHLNFPCHNFFDNTNQKIYCFYRQGQTFTVDANDTSIFDQQQIDVGDFGQVYIIYDKILMARSSNMIYFYKREQVIEQDVAKQIWVHYDQLDIRGMIYYTKGNMRFQITTDKLIYFYLIDQKTFKPELENCLYNFMGCSQMMFGPRLKYCITYKTGQTGFNIYKKRYTHKFLAKISSQTFEGSFGVNIDSKDQILITSGQNIQVYCQKTYKLIDQFEVPFPHSQKHLGTHLKQQILNVQNSLNDDLIAVTVGHQFVQNETILYQLYIYEHNGNSWSLKTQRLFPELVQNSSKWLTFNIKNYDEIFLIDKNQITVYNYVTQKYHVLYIFQSAMNSQPIYVKFNFDQSTALIASFHDVIYINFELDKEQDIDELFQISDIRSIIYAQNTKKYYLLANKCQELLGYYIIEFDESDLESDEVGDVGDMFKPKILLNWRSKLDIGNANLHLIVNEKEEIEQLIVSYKSIYINTYNVLVVDLKTLLVKFRHESFHLWESSMIGIVLKNNEFLMLSSQGFQVLGMSSRKDKIVLQDEYGQDWMLHHLESCNDLRLESSNSLLYTLKGKDMIISIQDQFEDNFGQTVFEDIYTIKLQEMTLRESLLCQSIISCRQQYDVFKLIQFQPAPELFFKSFLELDKTNLVTILSFDSRSIITLLDQKHEHLFQSKYPVFYKTRVSDEKCISAIDTAIDNNQIRATNSIIDYIVKYQNNVVFCYLFEETFVSLIEKGINVIDLLKSDIFFHRLDFMEWPSIHTDNCEMIRPYNGSMFKLRHNYSSIFPDFETCQENDDKSDEDNSSSMPQKMDNLKRQLSYIHEVFVQKRIFKIKYNLSILPSVSEEKVSLMDVLEDTQDLQIFDALAVEDLLDFKWHKYAKYVHFFGFGCHIIYMVFFSLYVNLNFVYNEQSEAKNKILHIMMGLFLFFPLVYDMTQLKTQGAKVYFSSIWNYLDQGHIWIGYANIFHQIWFLEKYKDSDLTDPELYEMNTEYQQDKHRSELIMILVTLIMLLKTFFFLRIFIKLSNLVAMMSQVVHDLKVFILFYVILIWMFSLIFNILQMGNYEFSIREDIQDIINLKVYPGQEYKYLPAWFRQCISVMRISLGDFDFGESGYLDPFENCLFWITWILITFLTCIVFLNFIIAEVSASYNKVTEKLHGLFLQERAQLIKESEDMIPSSWQKDIHKFPKYLITREVEK